MIWYGKAKVSRCVENHQGSMDGQPMRKIEDILHIAELCIDLLQENEDFYSEVGVSILNHIIQRHLSRCIG